MSSKLTKNSYKELVSEDIVWLNAMPDCLEKTHILAILIDSIRWYYPENKGEQ